MPLLSASLLELCAKRPIPIKFIIQLSLIPFVDMLYAYSYTVQRLGMSTGPDRMRAGPGPGQIFNNPAGPNLAGPNDFKSLSIRAGNLQSYAIKFKFQILCSTLIVSTS